MARAKYVFLNGELVPFDEAKVHVSSAAFKFGTAVFEGLRGYWNEKEEQMYLFRLDDHLARLEFSQRFMRFEEILDPAWIGEKTIELVRANELRETIHIMPTVFVSGFGGPGVCGPIGISIVANPGVSHGFVEKGCTAQVSAWRRPADAAMPMRVKCNANYQNGRLATVQAKADGYDTAILLNDRGKVAEGPGMCFFMVRDGRAVTPTTTSGILESITRATVLELLADRLGVDVEEREIDRSELPAAQEAFFCGTAWEVSPLVSIDRMPVGDGTPGEVTRRLQRDFFAIVKGEVADYPHWRTAVY